MSCSSFVSLRAVYRDCLVRVESPFRHCDDGLRIRRPGYRHHCFTDAASLRRLTSNVFHESEVQGPAQLMPSTPKQPASYSGEITSSTITATSPETSAPTAFRAPIMTAAADSNSRDPKDQAIDCGSNPRATD